MVTGFNGLLSSLDVKAKQIAKVQLKYLASLKTHSDIKFFDYCRVNSLLLSNSSESNEVTAKISLSSDETINTECIIICAGATPNTSVFKSSAMKYTLNKNGYVKVNKNLQVLFTDKYDEKKNTTLPYIFAGTFKFFL